MPLEEYVHPGEKWSEHGWPSSGNTGDVQETGPPQAPGKEALQEAPEEPPPDPASVAEAEEEALFSPNAPAMVFEPVEAMEPNPETSPPWPDPQPPPEPVYKPGKVIRRFSSYEFGNEETESHDTELLPVDPLPVDLETSGPEASISEISGPSTPGEELAYPYWDDQFFQMFITGQLPEGTVTHFSTHYEHGSNAWTDVSFERIVPDPVRKTPAKSPVPNVFKVHTSPPQALSPPSKTPNRVNAHAKKQPSEYRSLLPSDLSKNPYWPQ